MVMNPLLTTGGRHDTYATDEPSSTCPEISFILSGAVCSSNFFHGRHAIVNLIEFIPSGRVVTVLVAGPLQLCRGDARTDSWIS